MIAETATALDRIGLLDGDELSEQGHQLRTDIERTTDELEESILVGIGADLDAVIADLNAWSQVCVDAAAFPPNVFKRAAG